MLCSFPALCHCPTAITLYNPSGSRGCPRYSDLCQIRLLHCFLVTGFFLTLQLSQIPTRVILPSFPSLFLVFLSYWKDICVIHLFFLRNKNIIIFLDTDGVNKKRFLLGSNWTLTLCKGNEWAWEPLRAYHLCEKFNEKKEGERGQCLLWGPNP